MLDVRHLSGGTRSDESVFGTLYPAIVRLFYGFLRRVRKTFRSWWRDVRGAFGSLAKRSSSCGKESTAKGRYLVSVRGAGCCSARKGSGTVFLFPGAGRTCGMIRAAVCTGETGVAEWDFYEIIPIFR